MFIVGIFVVFVAGSQASMFKYDNYKVYRVTPINTLQIRFLKTLEKSKIFDFWMIGHSIHQPWDIMVEPKLQTSIESVLRLNKIKYEIFIENLEKTFHNDSSVDLARSERISFALYNNYSIISAYVKQLAVDYLNIVTLINIGKTSEGRDLIGVKISTGVSDKPAILIDGGIHAREWLAPAATTYIIQQLVENEANHQMIENVDWYIVPVLNPDGYEYTHTNDRLWRKTRSPGRICKGVDANRNWDIHWNEIGTSDDECDETYAGKRAFSEPETDQMKDFALQHKDNIKLYLTFHSYGSMLLYPWGFTSDYPDNADELQSLAEEVKSAIESVRGTSYVIGSSTNVLYPAAGGSDDWMMAVAGIPLVYTIELPGERGGYQPSVSKIKDVVEETFEGIKAYHKYIEKTWA